MNYSKKKKSILIGQAIQDAFRVSVYWAISLLGRVGPVHKYLPVIRTRRSPPLVLCFTVHRTVKQDTENFRYRKREKIKKYTNYLFGGL